MYTKDEAVKLQKYETKKSLVLGIVSLVAWGLFVWSSYHSKSFSSVYYAFYIVTLGLALYYTKLYLFLSPKERYATVNGLSFDNGYHNKLDEVNSLGLALYGRDVVKVTLDVTYDNGKQDYITTFYTGGLKELKAGERIGFFRFLKMPVRA